MGITVLIIVIWGGKSSFLQAQNAFYDYTDVSLENEICTCKTDLQKWQFRIQFSPQWQIHA